MQRSDDDLEMALGLVRNIRPLQRDGRTSPHKYLLLLAVAELYEHDSSRENRFPLDEELEATYDQVSSRLLPLGKARDALIEYPYSHLSSDHIWQLCVLPGKEVLFSEYTSRRDKRLTKRRIIETVSHAVLHRSLDACFRNKESRTMLIELLERQTASGLGPDFQKTESQRSTSLFAHEQRAINAIVKAIDINNLGYVLSNLEVHDPQSNRYFETDIVIVSTFGIYVVELKHWSGRVEIRPNSWLQNGSYFKKDPHKVNGFKAKLIRSLFEHRFPAAARVFVKSVVVFTNPESELEGVPTGNTQASCPTFDSIGSFIDYLKHERKNKGEVLRQAHVDGFAAYLKTLNQTPRPRDYVFPGYEVVERLYQHADRAEFVARPTDLRHRKLTRLRLFFPPPDGSGTMTSVSRERATATLNAVHKIGDHPNILKVWAVPNEDGLLVEGSDWSEAGTLQDYLEQEGPLSVDDAVEITRGILSGLEAAHRECVIHRALSPDSVLMAGRTPKLMNFDLSYQLEDDRTTVIPDVSELKLSPYMAPEVFSGGSLTEAADLFSVGAILFRALTGEQPFRSSTDLQSLGGHLSGAHREKLQSKQVPSHLIDLVFGLVRLDPAERPASVGDVVAILAEEPKETPSAQQVVDPEVEPETKHDVYEIEALICRGAEAQLYRARGPQGAQVVIKLFNSDVALARVINEQEMAASVRHPSVVKVEALHRWKDGRFFLPLRWVDGETLRRSIANSELPKVEDFYRVATQLLEALKCLHRYTTEEGVAQPVLHNDVKPDNIMLSDNGRAVLIDFGSASHPRVGMYEGTEGFVAPDLRLGQERRYCEDGDLFGLGVTLFEWFFGAWPYRQLVLGAELTIPETRPGEVSPELVSWFERAVATGAAERFESADAMARALSDALETHEARETGVLEASVRNGPEAAAPEEPQRIGLTAGEQTHGNPFVAYLNSLQSRDAASENALAESQATNQHFPLIHVAHPAADFIERKLLVERCHVLLTGHAGDGKSTIAVEILKRLRGIPGGHNLDEELPKRAEVEAGDGTVVIVKDLSEWSVEDRRSLLQEAHQGTNTRFLIVSNTGTLLDAFHECHGDSGWIEVENQMLRCFESTAPAELPFRGSEFTVINLSMVDNLDLAEKIFVRIIAEERWERCSGAACSGQCPVLQNIKLLKGNERLVRERLFLAYRRLYEYGARLTLRQLTAHLAYMVTSGRSCRELGTLGQDPGRPISLEFMFFNRFFGDNGQARDPEASQLHAVRFVRNASFGLRPCPTWERRLWAKTENDTFAIDAQGCEKDFAEMRSIGALDESAGLLSPSMARVQARRMLFFLHGFDESKDEQMFVRMFLDSPMILDFMRWQNAPPAGVSAIEMEQLKQRVLHVLQEHFTGVRLPEGRAGDTGLYVTLSRRSSEIRQSAQVVLVEVPKDDLELELIPHPDGFGGCRRILEVRVRDRGEALDAVLPLELPFLDYVMMRHQGDVGSALQPNYVNRLDRFRGRIIELKLQKDSDSMMLVRLGKQHTFRKQRIAVRDGRLEVFDG